MGDSSDEKEACYKLIFRYRHEKKTLNFYPPPKRLDEESKYWNQLLEATRNALFEAFGEVSKDAIGISQYVHGPVVPLSVLVVQPKRYVGSYLDLIIDDTSPYLSDLQTPLQPTSSSPNEDQLSALLKRASLESTIEVFERNKVDYEAFVLLDKEDLKEMDFPIGTRLKILQEIEKEKGKKKKAEKKQSKTRWEDSQKQLSLPKYVPVRVEAIPYERLLDVRYRENFAEFLKLHLRYFGWAFIKLPPEMVKQIHMYKEIWTNFFNSPQEYKEKCTFPGPNSGEYGGYYDENDRQMFQVTPLMLGCSPPWPEGDTEFQENAVKMFFMMDKIAKLCLSALAVSIGIDPQLFLDVTESQYSPRMLGSSVRVCMYKKQEENTGVICVPHTDTTLLTLGPVSSVPELQFYDRSKGEWVYAESEVDSDHVILFAGRMLARMTSGYFQPTYHRVFRRYGEERLSMPFFLRAKEDAIFENEKIIKTSNITNWNLPGGIAPREILITEPGGRYDFKPHQ